MKDLQKPFERPLSPHLQVYRLPMAALMSISHRITGVILSGGCLLVMAFIVSAAMGEQYYNKVMGLAGTLPGMIVLFGWSFALYYHLCSGVRHLIWDTGTMFEKKQVAISGWIVLIMATVLNAITWYAAGI